jgi:glycosyltransferase involved in cell wall biosynthesis
MRISERDRTADIKLLLIGDFTGSDDEGLAQISKRFGRMMDSHHQVLTVNTKEVIRPSTLVSIHRFAPDVVHYITGMTIRSLVVTAIIKMLLFNRPATVISAVRVFLTERQLKMLRVFSPDLVMTQAQKWEERFIARGIRTEFVPNPINIAKFRPLASGKKTLRMKYGLPEDAKIILHVGHIKPNRNLKVLIENSEMLKSHGYRSVVVGSTRFPPDAELVRSLQGAGCIVITGFIDMIEELYHCADVYLFPVKGLNRGYFPKEYNEVGVIDMPLSIIEAAATGLPVISTGVDAVERLAEISGRILTWDGTRATLLPLLERCTGGGLPPPKAGEVSFSEEAVRSAVTAVYSSLKYQ